MTSKKTTITHQRTIVLHLYVKQSPMREAKAKPHRKPEAQLEEAVGLAEAIALEVVHAESIALPRITPSTYIGSGKAEEIAAIAKEQQVAVVIMNAHITPTQQRNLEKQMQCKVIDRTALILEIFGERANTAEGRLQVELAALEYQKSRLVRSWTHLERQRGGTGFLGGPGETQIESDRRALRDRISLIKKQLEKVVKTRELHRKSRRAVPYPVVSLVGYTNAGKSTLFNYLTHAHVVAEDKLFATLDPTMRLLKLPSGRKIILSDTVGFISDLPTELVAAFRATLEEVVGADILLHVRDIASEDTEMQKADVIEVLHSLGLESRLSTHTIEVYNKVDKLDEAHRQPLRQGAEKRQNAVMLSALTGEGCEALLKKVDALLARNDKEITLTLSAAEGELLAWIYRHAVVLSLEEKGEKLRLRLSISEENNSRLKRKLKERVRMA